MLDDTAVKKHVEQHNKDLMEILESQNITLCISLDICNIRFSDILSQVKESELEAARSDWADRLIGLPSLSSLSLHADERARKVLASIRGVYFLYRKHSILPGIFVKY